MASQSFKPAPWSFPFSDQEIAGRAHEIFLREGSVDGNDQRDWFKAIEELTAEIQIDFGIALDSKTIVTGRLPARAVARGRSGT